MNPFVLLKIAAELTPPNSAAPSSNGNTALAAAGAGVLGTGVAMSKDPIHDRLSVCPQGRVSIIRTLARPYPQAFHFFFMPPTLHQKSWPR
jgi:hypothetical protein